MANQKIINDSDTELKISVVIANEEYQKQYKSNDKSHFSDAVEMREFFNDGVEILKEFKKRQINDP